MENSLSYKTVHPKVVFTSMGVNNMRESYLLDNIFFCSEKQKQACLCVDFGYLFVNGAACEGKESKGACYHAIFLPGM